ncbi:MAG: DUF1616 domain-containing protein [Candidatus Methanoperedens sp.]
MKTNIIEEISPDLKFIIVYLLITVVFLTIPPLDETIIRTILGIPLVLFIPGYVLIAALFPNKNDLDGIERIALNFGLSIAIVPLIGLGLNFTPWGIRFGPIIASLILFTLSLLIIANFRRFRLQPEERFGVPLKATLLTIKEEFTGSKNKTDKILTLILIISIIASLFTLVYVIVTPKQGEKFTEFYLLGPKGKAADYPGEVIPGAPINLIVGVVNHEYSDVNYTLLVQVKNDTFLERKIFLSNNETWEKPVSFTINTTGSNLKLEFLLYIEGNVTPYRETHLWINSSIGENKTNLTGGQDI